MAPSAFDSEGYISVGVPAFTTPKYHSTKERREKRNRWIVFKEMEQVHGITRWELCRVDTDGRFEASDGAWQIDPGAQEYHGRIVRGETFYDLIEIYVGRTVTGTLFFTPLGNPVDRELVYQIRK